MLLSGDVKSLEIVVCAYLSQDPILCSEVREGVDFHSLNQQRFRLPDRTTAKRFKFKLIYGAGAYGFANDSDFTSVGFSQSQWQGVIDEYYEKYKGVQRWHNGLCSAALREGKYCSPTGRVYRFAAGDVAARMWFWRPKILNYPVQGLGADLVMLARISLWRRLGLNPEYKRVLPISSVHDSAVLDMDANMCYTIGKMLRKVVQDVPANFERVFGLPFNLPLDAEIKMGQTLGHMEKIECS